MRNLMNWGICIYEYGVCFRIVFLNNYTNYRRIAERSSLAHFPECRGKHRVVVVTDELVHIKCVAFKLVPIQNYSLMPAHLPNVEKLLQLDFFICENRKKSHRAMSGECGASLQNSQTSYEV